MADTSATSSPTVSAPLLKATGESIPTIIRFTDGCNEQEAFFLKLVKSTLDDETLSDLRANIAGLTECIKVAHLPFCTKKGAVVPDTFAIQEYLNDCLNINLDDAKVLDVYMKSANVYASKNWDETISASRVIDSEKLAGIKEKVDETTFKLLTGTSSKYIPELEEQDWSIVNESNSLCYGIRVVRSRKGNVAVGVEQARYPAFRLKRRTIMSDALTDTSLRDVEVRLHPVILRICENNMDLRIPEYIIDDKSYITIYETESSAQLAMATSAFSQTDVEAAVTGSFWGCTLSAKASYGQTISINDATKTTKTSKQVTIAYNFPRATVFLDEKTLELTPQCQTAISRIVDGPSLSEFLTDYGEFFSRRVQLGGRLFATEDVSTAEAGSAKETVNSMKAAASFSFSAWGAAEASISASHEQRFPRSSSSATSSSMQTLTWQANGGNTLLANREWAPTVAYHWNWRITKQDDVCPLIDLIKKLGGQSELAERVKSYAPGTSLGVSPEKHKRFTLNADGFPNGRYLVVFRPSAKDLVHTADVINAAAKKVVIHKTAHLFNRGCVLLGPKEAIRGPIELALEAETRNGAAATVLHYGTEYYIRHVATDLWIDFHDKSDPYRPLYAASEKDARVRFIDPDKTGNTGPIASDGKVRVDFPWKSKSVYVYNAVEDVQRDNAIVCATTENDTSKTAQILRMRY